MVSFMGHHADNFSLCRLTWVPARDPIVSYVFPWIPMQSHAKTMLNLQSVIVTLLLDFLTRLQLASLSPFRPLIGQLRRP